MFSSNNAKLVAILAEFVLIVIAILLWPMGILWAINTLLPTLAISYGFWQWLAVVILQISTFGGLNFHLREISNKP